MLLVKCIQGNPLLPLLDGWRALLEAGPGVAGPGVAESCLGFLPWALGTLLVGCIVFDLLEPEMADQV